MRRDRTTVLNGVANEVLKQLHEVNFTYSDQGQCPITHFCLTLDNRSAETPSSEKSGTQASQHLVLRNIDAAFAPIHSQYLFYVYKGNGHHAFAKTLEEHNANVERYLR